MFQVPKLGIAPNIILLIKIRLNGLVSLDQATKPGSSQPQQDLRVAPDCIQSQQDLTVAPDCIQSQQDLSDLTYLLDMDGEALGFHQLYIADNQ